MSEPSEQTKAIKEAYDTMASIVMEGSEASILGGILTMLHSNSLAASRQADALERIAAALDQIGPILMDMSARSR